MFSRRLVKWILIFFGILIISVATYAFAAANIVPPRKAGEGSGTIGDYVIISTPQYILNADDPRNIDRVTFTLNAAAATVKVKVVSGSANWYTCILISGFNWGCATTSPQVTAQNAVSGGQLRVIAAQ